MTNRMPKRAHGAYVATAVRSLRASGLTGKSLEIAIGALTKQKTTTVVKLPRKVYRTVCDSLSKYERIVVVNKGGKSFKIYSFEGYMSTKKHGVRIANENRPWEFAAKKRSEDAIARSKTPEELTA